LGGNGTLYWLKNHLIFKDKGMLRSHYIVFGLIALGTTANAETNGIGSETVQLIPNVSVGGEYRSNLYLDEGEGVPGASAVVPGTALLVNPTLSLNVNSDFLNLRLGSGYGVRRYVQEDLQNLNSFNDARATLSGRLLPKSPVGISFSDTFSSNNRPVNQPKAESALIRVYDNKARAGIGLGSGNALNVNLGGAFNYREINGMRDANGDRLQINKRNTVGGTAVAEWKFLPKTKFVVDGLYYANTWDQNSIQTGDSNEVTVINNSTNWDFKGGIQGQLSGKTLVRVLAGVGGSTYGESDSAIQLKGLSQKLRLDTGIRFKPTESQDFRLEYRRAFQDVYFTNFNLYHQVGATYEATLQDRAVFKLNAQYRNDNYDGPVDRTDHRVQAGTGLAINISDKASFESGLTWRRLASADGIATIEYDDIGVTFGLKVGY
jgi:hypothetical protein